MSKSKFSDAEMEQCEAMGMKPSEIAKKFGVTPAAITQRQAKKNREQEAKLPTEEPVPEPVVAAKPFPFKSGDQVIYSGRLHTVESVGEARMILRQNANLQTVTIMLEDYNAGRAYIIKCDEKKTNAYEKIRRNTRRPDEEPEADAPKIDYLDLPEEPKEDEPGIAAEKPILKKPGMTVKPEFEALFTAVDVASKKDIDAVPGEVGSINLDLEMDELSDPDPYIDEPSDLPGWPSEPKNYTDPEWGVVSPKKGTIECAIWERAYNEIEEYHKAKQEVECALISGCRLPAIVTDRYNRIVSKYSGEVGA